MEDMRLPQRLLRLFDRGNGLEVRVWTNLYRLFFGRIGKGAVICRADSVISPDRIFIGDQVGIGHGARLDALQEFAGQAYEGSIHIGDRTSIQPYFHVAAAAKMCIGHDILIASRVYISDHDHQFGDASKHVGYQPLTVAPVRIEDFVWIGENVVILKGVVVGHHAIIGANSVVTHDIPPFAIVAGAPAKVIKMRPRSEPEPQG